MSIDVYQNYSQFYKGTESLKTYGNGRNQKDTLVKYEFNTTDEHGNKVMDKMTREETLQAMKDISSLYGDNVMVEFSGDGMAKLIESKKGEMVRTLSEEEVAARQAEFDSQVVQMEGTYKKVEGNAGIPDNDFHTILKENDPDLARQVEEMNSRIINHKPGDPSNAKEFNTLMRKAMDVVSRARDKADTVQESKNSTELKLSEKAQKLLQKLRKAYGNMDFMVLAPGGDAKALLAGSTKEISVIFSAEELEKMASDEKYEKEYMNRVQGALRMSDDINKKFGYESAFGKNGGNGEITKIGISFNSDGTTSIFAELEKLSANQKERIEKAREEKRITVQANSMEDLMEKIRKVDWNTI